MSGMRVRSVIPKKINLRQLKTNHVFPIGLDRIHKAMAGYVKSISKRNEGDDKERTLPIAYLGGSMVSHGEDFDAYSEYGRCLTSKSTSCYLSGGRN